MRFEERIADWQRRLVALADRPEYAYSGMTESEITWHYETLTSFKGFAEADVAAAERLLDVRFPRAFRDFLLAMGAASGQLLCGGFSDGLEELAELRDATEELIRDSESGFELPARAVVFLMRQGYQVLYVLGDGGEDGPVFLWSEGDDEATELAASFEELLGRDLDRLVASNRRWRERGGYYLECHPSGEGKMTFPALASGERPLDRPPRPVREAWWRR